MVGPSNWATGRRAHECGNQAQVEGGTGKRERWRDEEPHRLGTNRQAQGGTNEQGEERQEARWRGAQMGYPETERDEEGRREAQM